MQFTHSHFSKNQKFLISLGMATFFVFSWQTPSFGASVKTTAATKSAAAYKKMSTFACKTKNLAPLCTTVKSFYKKNPTKFTEQAFIDSICKKDLKQCALFSGNTSYKAMSKKYLAKTLTKPSTNLTPKATTTPALTKDIVSRSNNTDQPLDFGSSNDSSGDFFPNYDPMGRANKMDTPTGRYIEEQLADPVKKIDFFANALITGENAGFLQYYSNDNFTEQEVLEIINKFRDYYNLSPLSLSQKLVKSVESQKKYVDNIITARSLGGTPPPEETVHEQNPQDQFFTGKTATDRARYQGYENLPVAEGISFGRNATLLGALHDLLYVPAHRSMFIDPYAKDIGFYIERDDDINSTYSGLTNSQNYKTFVINISLDYSKPWNAEDLVYPKNGTILSEYDGSLAEAGYPFNNEGTDAVDAIGTAFTIINYKTGIQRNTIKLYDLTSKKDLNIYLDVFNNPQMVYLRNAPKSPLTPGHDFQISYTDKNGKIHTSVFSTAPDENTVEF